MSKHQPQAMLASNAQSNALSKSTYVRTYLRRTTYLEHLSHVGHRAQGGSKNLPTRMQETPLTVAAPRDLIGARDA